MCNSAYYSRAQEGQAQASEGVDYRNVGLDYGEDVVPTAATTPAPSLTQAPPAPEPPKEKEKEKDKERPPPPTRREWREREIERERERRAKEREEKKKWNALGTQFGIHNYYKFRTEEVSDQRRVEKEQEAKSEVVIASHYTQRQN